MKYKSLLWASFFVLSVQPMENKSRRDCCYLAALTKNIMCNVPGAMVYTSVEFAANATIAALTKLQTILEVPQDIKQKRD